MSPVRLNVAVSLLLVVVAACESKTNEADFMKEVMGLLCARYAQCGVVADEAACVAGLTPNGGFPSDFGPDVAFDAQKASLCLEAIRGWSCELANPNLQALAICEEALHGTVADGGACHQGLECRSGDCHVDRSCADQCCAGTCSPKLRPGDTCALFDYDPATRCPGGTSCSCMSGPCECRPRVADGQPCYTVLDCADDSVCTLSVTTFDGTCQKPLAAGATCDPGIILQCGSGLGCDPATLRCVPLLPNGASCTTGGLACVAFTSCVDSACTPLPGPGEACTYQCAIGYECTAGACTKTPFCL